MKRDLFAKMHYKTKRNYYERMNLSKVQRMEVASNFDKDYWDGDKEFGYGGYIYDGRWKSVAEELITIYSLNASSKVLDIGCGKAYLLYEIQKITGCEVLGVDISHYAISHALPEVKDKLIQLDISSGLPFKDKEFDLAISLMTLHNLDLISLKKVFSDIDRVSKYSYVTVESYRNHQELFNLQCWALTCKSFFTPEEWEYIFELSSFKGDYEFLFFE